MALSGTGAILIWNGITPEGRDDFYDWHIREHIPERVAIEGFRRGRRYIAATAETRPEFFTLYETANIEVTTSAPYLARLNAPTDWTKRATSHFRDTSRALTRVAASAGPGLGGMLATLQFRDTDEGHAALARAVDRAPIVVDQLTRISQITGAHVCATNTSASAARTAESKDRTDIQAPPIGAVLVEGCNLLSIKSAVELVSAQLELQSADLSIAVGFYQLEYLRLEQHARHLS